jgi:hypothetical protein
MKKVYMLLILSLVASIIFYACDGVSCKLTNDDKEYLYENGTEIKFLENGTDTVIITAETSFNIRDESSAMGLPDLEKEETGSSILYFNNNYRFGIHRIACADNVRFSLYQINENNNILHLSERVQIDSVLAIPITILGGEYNNYYLIEKNDSANVIQTLYYAKEIGVLKIEFFNGYTLELIP